MYVSSWDFFDIFIVQYFFFASFSVFYGKCLMFVAEYVNENGQFQCFLDFPFGLKKVMIIEIKFECSGTKPVINSQNVVQIYWNLGTCLFCFVLFCSQSKLKLRYHKILVFVF